MNNFGQNNNDMQKRMLMMTVIVFVFFMAYEYFYMMPKQKAEEAKQAKQSITKQVEVSKDNGISLGNMLGNNSKVSSSKEINKETIIATVQTNNSSIEIDNLGRIAQVTMTTKRYIDEDSKQIKLFAAKQLRPLEVRFAKPSINEEAFKVNVKASTEKLNVTNGKKELILTQELTGTILTKKLTFYPDGHYDLEVNSTNNEQFYITNGLRPDVLADMYAIHGSILELNNETLQTIEDGDLDEIKTVPNVNFVSNFDRYYTTVLYNFKNPFVVTYMPDSESDPQAFVKVDSSIVLNGYIGPKEHKTLASLNKNLVNGIDYGWFTFIARPMFSFLAFIQNYVGNWGWSIVILTILIKLVLFPLTFKGMVSMQKLKDLAPKMKEIQAKYKDDKQKQSMHMMELYKKHGANPMGGCLPLLIQIPIFFAIYRVLLNAIELKGAEWILWVHDLAEMDPFYVLPILMGLSMFIQQKITPTTVQDPMQQKIFHYLPIVFTFFFLWFPAGLTLYWFTNNVFTILQQGFINRAFDKKRREKENK